MFQGGGCTKVEGGFRSWTSDKRIWYWSSRNYPSWDSQIVAAKGKLLSYWTSKWRFVSLNLNDLQKNYIVFSSDREKIAVIVDLCRFYHAFPMCFPYFSTLWPRDPQTPEKDPPFRSGNRSFGPGSPSSWNLRGFFSEIHRKIMGNSQNIMGKSWGNENMGHFWEQVCEHIGTYGTMWFRPLKNSPHPTIGRKSIRTTWVCWKLGYQQPEIHRSVIIFPYFSICFHIFPYFFSIFVLWKWPCGTDLQSGYTPDHRPGCTPWVSRHHLTTSTDNSDLISTTWGTPESNPPDITIEYPLVNKHRPWKSPIFNGN